jgi:hypothetical protein
MLMRILAVSSVLTLSLAPQAPHPLGSTIVSVADGSGRVQGTFQPRPTPYREGARPPLRVPLVHQQDVVDAKGIAVTGFGFAAWIDGDVVRLQVLAMVPAPGAPNRYLWRESDDRDASLRMRPFSLHLLKIGQTVVIDAMKTLKVSPMRVTLEARSK